jgi:glycosyltransferase involved in cell wall biosynthesis
LPSALIVSHPAVLAVNQLPYAELLELGWDVTVVVPDTWRHDYAAQPFRHEALPELEDRIVGSRVLNAGAVQRHLYLSWPGKAIRDARPDLIFIEEEPTSIPGLQWGLASRAKRIPFALQIDENLDRPYPRIARAIRGWTLRNASFLAARSPAAAGIARSWGYAGPAPLVPHAVPAWDEAPRPRERQFTVGFAGRFVEEKGLRDLVEAVRGLPGTRLRLVGNGPLLDELRNTGLPEGTVEIDTEVTHERMADAYRTFDVLALPSRTTPRWAEQFGRVLVEALWCGVPVVGSDSGEIPWVIGTTGGGLVFPEGDVPALRDSLAQLRDDPDLRKRLAVAGRAAVSSQFGIEAAARALDEAMRSAIGAKRT